MPGRESPAQWRGMTRAAIVLSLLLALVAGGCSRHPQQPPASASAVAEPPPPPPAYEAALPADLRAIVDRTYTGDLDGMVKRRLIRVGAPFNRTFYFIDKGVQRGLSYEYATLFEDQLNRRLNTGNLQVHVVLVPMSRDQLLPKLRAGKIDMAVAQLTITPERLAEVDFSRPTRENVNEVLVTGPAPAGIGSPESSHGAAVFVRRSSSYWASLQAYNARQAALRQPTIDVHPAPEVLEDDDLLEMVNAGLMPATVVDDYLAQYWKQVFPNLVVHENLAVRTGGKLAVAIRKHSPGLAAELNGFIADHGFGSVFGRTLIHRYLQSTQLVTDADSETERRKFEGLLGIFRKYGQQYDFDYLLMAAQAYQESRLDQNARSRAGAIGIMQLLPATGQALGVGDIRQLEPNIHAGIKYMRQVRDAHFERQPMDALDKGLFTFAAYDAGAGKIEQLRRETALRGLDPNVWFGNVERLTSERIGRETVTYVSNIYKYYLAYRLITEESERRRQAKLALGGRSGG